LHRSAGVGPAEN
jgi:hypothetical protein